MNKRLKTALNHPIWKNRIINDKFKMDGKSDEWEISYYPIFEDGKTGEEYNEPRALVEKPIEGGIDFREVPLRYLDPVRKTKKWYQISWKFKLPKIEEKNFSS